MKMKIKYLPRIKEQWQTLTTIILIFFMLFVSSQNTLTSVVYAQSSTPVVDGLLDGSYTFLRHFNKQVLPGKDKNNVLAPGDLYGYEGTNYCYWAFVVDRAFNDNVYAPKKKKGRTANDEYNLRQDGWVKEDGSIRDHDFKALHKSDHAQFAVQGPSGTYTVTLDLLHEVTPNSVYTSGVTGQDGSDLTSSPGNQYVHQAATSLYWNIYNSGWSDYVNRSPNLDYNTVSGNYWEWQIIYEFSIAKSDLASIGITTGCGNVTQSGAHNSPSKDIDTLGKIGDLVWEDLDGDGIQDSGEPGIANVTVYLIDASTNTTIRTTQTSPSGYYIFNNLDAGSYYVEFVLPSGYAFTKQDQGSDNTVDSDANPSTGQTTTFSLTAGQTDLTWDAGLYRPVSLGDFVWEDDGNGIQETGESGIPNVPVQLFDATCASLDSDNNGRIDSGLSPINTTTTNTNGIYQFTNLAPGDYCVIIPSNAFNTGQPLDGYNPSPKVQGSDRSLDSNGTGPDLIYNYSWADVTLQSNQDDFTIDFGFFAAGTPTAITLSSLSASSGGIDWSFGAIGFLIIGLLLAGKAVYLSRWRQP